jgi:hypothetical protein
MVVEMPTYAKHAALKSFGAFLLIALVLLHSSFFLVLAQFREGVSFGFFLS